MTWKARFKSTILRSLEVLCWVMAHVESQLFLLHSHPGSVLHCEATCMHVNIPSSHPNSTSTPCPPKQPPKTVFQAHWCAHQQLWLCLPQEKILGMRPTWALEAGSVLLRLESSGSQISKDLSRSGAGRLQMAMEDTWHMEKGGKNQWRAKEEAATQSLCQGPFPLAQ